MNKLKEYFSTDWSAMTTSDWVGLIVTIVVFIGMAYTFYKALKPSKREALEQEKYKILDD